MGKRVNGELFDDLEPELEAETERQFAAGSVSYHLDLSEKNARLFDKELEKWVDVAARITGSGGVGRKRTGKAPGPSGGESGLPLAEIRSWAKANGHEVAEKGRVSAEIVRAWKAAHETREQAGTGQEGRTRQEGRDTGTGVLRSQVLRGHTDC